MVIRSASSFPPLSFCTHLSPFPHHPGMRQATHRRYPYLAYHRNLYSILELAVLRNQNHFCGVIHRQTLQSLCSLGYRLNPSFASNKLQDSALQWHHQRPDSN